MNAPDSPPSSRTITFYSYKGGTGRSMALANVAWILACSGRRVLVIDWDLEAPGLHRYFTPFLSDPDLVRTRGIIDFVWELAIEAGTENHGEDDPQWFVPLADFRRVAVSLEYDFPAGGGIDFVPAGCQNSVYSERVTTFDWNKFYRQSSGGVFLETARQKARLDYDYILIDSRTGVSDTSGICTVQFPDLLILCFTANNQSIKGAAGIAKSVRAQWTANPESGGTDRRIFPLLTRVDGFERERLDRRRELAQAEFAFLLRGTEGLLELPYIPVYSYEETLAVFRDRPEHKEAVLLPGIERLTALISDGTVTRLESPPNEIQRQRTLARFEGREASEIENASKLLEASRFDVFISHAASDGPAVAEIAHRFREEGLRVFFAPQEIKSGLELKTHFDAALAASSSMVIFIGPSGLQASQNVAILSGFDRRRAQTSAEEFRIVPVFLPGAEPGSLDLPPMLRVMKAIVFRASLNEEQTLDQLAAAIREPVLSRTKEIALVNPYKGLENFRSADSKYFFARESVTEELLSTIRRSLRDGERLVWVVGASGSGKTSLLRAGLLPRLAQGAIPGSADWQTIIVRPSPHLAEDLAREILSTWKETREHSARGSEVEIASKMLKDPSTLAHVARQIAGPPDAARKIVLIVDPLEEILTIEDAETREACIDNVIRASSDQDGPVIVVAAMRSDFYSRCLEYPGLTHSLTMYSVTVGPLTEAELREAIVRPAQMVSCEFEQGLVELLLRDTLGQAEALPLLQLALRELWENREGRRLTVASYSRMKGLSGVIAARASELLNSFDEKERRLTRRIFLALINVGENENATRTRVPVASLAPEGDSKAALVVIRKLIDARLLTVQSDPSDRSQTVGIAHDALIERWEPLRVWIEDSRKNLRARTMLSAAAREWRANGEQTDYLYKGRQLQKISQAIDADDDLPELEVAFLRRSSTYVTVALRRTVWIILWLATVGVATYFTAPYVAKYLAARSVAASGFTWRTDSKTLKVLPAQAPSVYNLSTISKPAQSLQPKVLDLTGCNNLLDTSALLEMHTLEILSLDDCSKLENLDGLGNLISLQVLTMERCSNLQSIDGLKRLHQLRFVDLQGCNKLEPKRLLDLKAALPQTVIRPPAGPIDF